MPELPEIRIMTAYINKMCDGRTFLRARTSDVTKMKVGNLNIMGPELRQDALLGKSTFTIKAKSRGKEISLQLDIRLNISGNLDNDLCIQNFLDFNMGTSGNWMFVDTGDEPTHSHLMFDTTNGCTLCLVDPRRFAKWKATPHPFQDPMSRDDDLLGHFAKMMAQPLSVNGGAPIPTKRTLRYVMRRGPDPIDEHERFLFRITKAIGILDSYGDLPNLRSKMEAIMKMEFSFELDGNGFNQLVKHPDFVPKNPVFLQPICEVLLNQKYFNGIGNYLRSEIMHRANVDPFMPAWKAIIYSQLSATQILELCKTVPLEAEALGGSDTGAWQNPNGPQPGDFRGWLQCYGNKSKLVGSTLVGQVSSSAGLTPLGFGSFLDSKNRRVWCDRMYLLKRIVNKEKE